MPGNFLRRNGVLVALADALVIVQAGVPSGALNAARWARKLRRPVWAVPGPPWDPKFVGCRAAIDAGARVVTSIGSLLRALGLGEPAREEPAQGQLPLGSPLSSSSPPSPSPPSPRRAPRARTPDRDGRSTWTIAVGAVAGRAGAL